MKQKLLLIGLLLIIGTSAFAKQVDENTAQQIGRNFLSAKTNSPQLKAATTLQLVYKASSKNSNVLASQQPRTLFYVLNAGTGGFVIVAGDDNVSPILGYSDERTFDPDKIPYNVAKWLEGYKTEIRYVIDKNIHANQEISDEWKQLKSATIGVNATASVSPLMKTKWDQSPYYNALCPDKSVTGCVATAMAQIMKYWNYPATGSGFHSYRHSTYGTLSANFGSTTYQWSSMPNSVNSSNNAVATLMYQVGISVDMNYSPDESGAYVLSETSPETNCSEYALKTYFGYDKSLKGIIRDNFTQSEWISLLKKELDAGRPILYDGYGTDGGHCFVADGYDTNNYIHFNWGWSGAYDGYFRINALNPDDVGTGGGSGGYNSGQEAIIGIKPLTGTQTYDLALSAEIIPSYEEIYFIESFTVTTNIKNSGGGSFKGDYTAAIFDDSYNFVDYIQTFTGYSLPGGSQYTKNLKFSTEGLVSMLPGTYYIGIFYRPEGGNWIEVADGSYKNFVKITVINPNDIELYSEMKITSGTTLTQGQPISVNLNVLNSGKTTFTGKYYLGLYNLDGTWAQDIDSIPEDNGLPSGYSYQDPCLTFSTASVTVSPGTYLLVSQYTTKSDDWYITGSTDYKNPIKVTVVAPSIQPDIYESNNTIAQSFKLPVAFSGNNAKVTTGGSNCHITSDNDFYKVELPSGYQYTITPRLDDSSDKKSSYSLDGLFSYSLDGNNWSDVYDNVMPGNIILDGGKTVYFHVAPYFAGLTGTYMLEMTITRTQSTGIVENILADNLKVYPNPAKEFVIVDFNDINASLNQLALFNAQGGRVYLTSLTDQPKTLHLPLANFSEGIYILQIQTYNGLINKKIVVSK
ncbi:MAG: C10 family peptidase [Prolixibacteraceae bacterium]|nr:C10 family peptidase [Prolixibacteraceae bacterium]